MRFSVQFLVLFFSALFLFSTASFAETSIAVVDMKWLSSESDAAKDIRDQIKEHREALQKEFSSHEKILMDTEQKLLKEKADLAPEDFSEKKKAFEEKILSTRKLFQEKRTNLDKAYSTARMKLRKEILEIVADIVEEENYLMVVERGSVVIAQKELDITKKVMDRLNAKIKKIKLELDNG